ALVALGWGTICPCLGCPTLRLALLDAIVALGWGTICGGGATDSLAHYKLSSAISYASQDDMASAVGDKCTALAEKELTEDFEALNVRARVLKGLIELVKGDIKLAEPFFDQSLHNKPCDSIFFSTLDCAYCFLLHLKDLQVISVYPLNL
ncbi:hypothetical protein L195_g051515, partial [Trifolium pratense]